MLIGKYHDLKICLKQIKMSIDVNIYAYWPNTQYHFSLGSLVSTLIHWRL